MPEFISILRWIRDIVYPQMLETNENVKIVADNISEIKALNTSIEDGMFPFEELVTSVSTIAELNLLEASNGDVVLVKENKMIYVYSEEYSRWESGEKKISTVASISKGDNASITDLSDISGEINKIVIVEEMEKGGVFIYDSTKSNINNGGTIFNGWTRRYNGIPNVKWFGAKCDGITNDSIAILNALEHLDTLEVSSDCYAPDVNIFNSGNAVFLGKGKITSYRKNTTDYFHATDVLESLGVHGKHLQTFRKAERPVVVLIGDSTNTYTANSIGRGDMLADCIHQTLDRQCPEGIAFHNRAIGGKAYSSLFDSQYASYIPWYTGKNTTTWINLVKELNPDLVIFGFGMNDSSGINPFYVKSAIEELQTWSKIPSIVLATPLVPSPTSEAYNQGREGQEGRDRAAGIIRSFANYKNVGLLDFNRRVNMVRDGFDILSTSFKKGDYIIPSTTGTNDSAIGTEQVYDFKVKIKLNPSTFSISNYITVKTGSGASDYILISKPSSNQIKVDAIYGNTGTVPETEVYYTGTNAYSYPVTTSYSLTIEKKGNYISIYREDDSQYGAFNEPIFFFKCISFGGLYNPIVLCPTGTNAFTEVEYIYSVPKTNLPSIKNNTLWGIETPSQIGEYGGSGFNHPSGFMATHVYRPLIDSIEWHNGYTRSASLTVGDSGTVTQATNKNTQVTLNKQSGTIVLNNSSLDALSSQTFVFSNSKVTEKSVVYVSTKFAGGGYNYSIKLSVSHGSCYVTIKNETSGALAESVQINFIVMNI